MGYVEPLQDRGKEVWAAPLHNWCDVDMDGYREDHKLEKSEVSKQLCMSGECLCGAFAHPGERTELAHHFPEHWAYLAELERRVKAKGLFYDEWGTKKTRPRAPKTERLPLFMPLCSDCVHVEKDSTDVPPACPDSDMWCPEFVRPKTKATQ